MLNFVFGANDYNPRFSIIATMKLFQKASECSARPEYQNICKPIREEFLEEFSEIVVKKTGFSEYRNFRIIEQLAWEKHKKALRLVRDILRDNRAFVYEIASALLDIWKEGRFIGKSNLINIFRESPITEKSANPNKVKLNAEVEKLFRFLDNNFDHDVDSIRLFLITSFM